MRLNDFKVYNKSKLKKNQSVKILEKEGKAKEKVREKRRENEESENGCQNWLNATLDLFYF